MMILTAVAVLFLLSLAGYRVIHLWMFDSITVGLRATIIGVVDEDTEEILEQGWLMGHPNRFTQWLYGLLTCQWCLGVWVAGVSTALTAAAVLATVDAPWAWPVSVLVWAVAWWACAAVQAFWFLVEDLLEHTALALAEYTKQSRAFRGK